MLFSITGNYDSSPIAYTIFSYLSTAAYSIYWSYSYSVSIF